MIPRVWQWDFICITQREENQGIVWAFLECVALNQIKFIDQSTVILKEVHSIGPIIMNFVSHLLTIVFAGET